MSCKKYNNCEKEIKTFEWCCIADCFESSAPLQIPQATRDRYEEYKQLRELSNFYGEKQKTKMFMQEIRKVLADFGLDIEDNKQT